MVFRLFLSLIVSIIAFASPTLAAPQKHILIMMTSHQEFNGTGKKTGIWLSNVTTPYYIFKNAGYDVTLASIDGLRPPIDPRSEISPDASAKKFLADKNTMQQFNDTLPLVDVKADHYDAIFLPGGHGAMWDSVDNALLTELLSNLAQKHAVIAAVDHGPAALLQTIDADGKPLVTGRKMAGFTREEEIQLGVEAAVPYYVDLSLEHAGAIVVRSAPFKANAVQDGNVITGQNPASAEKVARLVVKALGNKN